MTVLLRPPLPLEVSCDVGGVPRLLRVWGEGRTRRATGRARSWMERRVPLDGVSACVDRVCHRLVLDDAVVWDVYEEEGAWFLQRILD